jgi:GTP cyclohydrolase I
MNKNLPNHPLDNAEQDLLKLMADSHISSSIDTPMREDAFDLDDDTKIELIEKHFSHIMNILGLDLSDDSLKDTPKRVAKMYVKEIFSGLNPASKPSVTLFDNHYKYNQMLVERNIAVYSTVSIILFLLLEKHTLLT